VVLLLLPQRVQSLLMPCAESAYLLPWTGICHHQEAPDSKGHAGAAGRLAADPGTFRDASHVVLPSPHQQVYVLPALGQHCQPTCSPPLVAQWSAASTLHHVQDLLYLTCVHGICFDVCPWYTADMTVQALAANMRELQGDVQQQQQELQQANQRSVEPDTVPLNEAC
jgi:hypothetical protein